MAVPFLLLLPPSARLAYDFIRSGFRQGLSSRAIESVLRNNGLSISRGRSILPLMRKFREIDKASANIRNIGKSRVPNVGKYPEALTPIRRQYSHLVRVGTTRIDGETRESFITVATDRADLTVGEIETLAVEAVELHDSGNVEQIENVTLVQGLQRTNPLLR